MFEKLFGATEATPKKDTATAITSYFTQRGFRVDKTETSGLIFNWKITQYHLIDKNGIEIDTAIGDSGLQGLYRNYQSGLYGPVQLDPIVAAPPKIT